MKTIGIVFLYLLAFASFLPFLFITGLFSLIRYFIDQKIEN